MKIRSLSRRTDLIFAKFSGSVTDRGSYTLIQTPSNPGFHWGNYLIFDHAPKLGDLKKWKGVFDREFNFPTRPQHYVFTWDTETEDPGQYQEFLDANFDFDLGVVLTATQLNPPPHLNSDVTVKKIHSDQDWEDVTQLQLLCADPKFLNSYHTEFKLQQMSQYKKMSEADRGDWFGAFLDGKLVADLGIYSEEEIGRYQNVETHPDFRKQGICGTLVYQAGISALKDFGITTLVMEADPEYHAARVYESVGFKRTETNYSLSWWATKI